MTNQNPLLTGASLDQPTVLLDPAKAKTNIHRMVHKMKNAGVRFRPHFKTHQSAEIGTWFQNEGVDCITVSSVDMAYYFAEHGWDDITIATPVNPRQLSRIDELAKGITLHILVDTPEVLPLIANTISTPIQVWVKIDVGFHRVGIPMHDLDAIEHLVLAIQEIPVLHFEGLLAYAGQTYAAHGIDAVKTIFEQSVQGLLTIKQHLHQLGVEGVAVSMGDTPSGSLLDNFTGVDEMRHGNFVFYDLMQWQMGTCSDWDIAVAVACPVLGKYPKDNRIAIYGGCVHLSKDSLVDAQGKTIFGYVGQREEDRWGAVVSEAPVVSLSQEIGLLQVTDPWFSRIHIGDILLILPIHSCLTCNLFPAYHTLEGQVISKFRNS